MTLTVFELGMNFLTYFNKKEWFLWISSLVIILVSQVYFGDNNGLTLVTSLIGATALIFTAKANPIGPGLLLVFSVIYAYYAISNNYYGEVCTYLFMMIPMIILVLHSWLSNPYEGKKSIIKINRLSAREIWRVIIISPIVTTIFYFVLAFFNTPYLIVSTLGIATSFVAVKLEFRRSAYFALAFALNDLTMIALWLMQAKIDTPHYSLVICFIIFFVNDLYTFYNWLKMKEFQELQLKKEG